MGKNLGKNTIKEVLLITIGVLFLALGVHFFLVPHNLAVGGVTGLAIVLNKFIPAISIGLFMLIMNIILFIVGFIFIGSAFGGKTIYASLSLSFIIMILEKIFPIKSPLTNDIFIELLFGILLGAVGMAVVFEQNASTGGTDIIAKILNKYFHIDIGRALLVVDFFVTLLATIAFGPKIGMYALLGVIINGITIDAVIQGLNICKKVEIVSTKDDEIIKFIMEDLGRGATVYKGKGAYTSTDKEIITTVLNKKEFIKLKNYIKGIDENAFIVTYNVHETLGNGFKSIHD
ncbi:YitT family protein [Hathewaya histolytica]|uniref:Transporter n=1 Tax=Hathewaya histolytica TaxID=1498 RepID=A0A4U9R8C3_HATHI|nr:YitT family protein [Hathewaya histolytica]VTQ86403.1 transporter [Hathewaya histolytica]